MTDRRAWCFVALVLAATGVVSSPVRAGSVVVPGGAAGGDPPGSCGDDFYFDTGADFTILSRECADKMGLLKDSTGTAPDQAAGARFVNGDTAGFWCFENIAVAAISSANQNCVVTLPMAYVSIKDDIFGDVSILGYDWQSAVDACYRAKGKSTSWPWQPPEPSPNPAPKKESVPETNTKSGELKMVLPGMSFSNGPNSALVDMIYVSGADYSVIPRSVADRLDATKVGTIDLATADPLLLAQLELASMNLTLQSVFDVVQVSAYDLGLGIAGGTATLLVSADANSDFGVLGDNLLANGDYLFVHSAGSSFLTLNAVPEPSTIIPAATALVLAGLILRRRAGSPRRPLRPAESERWAIHSKHARNAFHVALCVGALVPSARGGSVVVPGGAAGGNPLGSCSTDFLFDTGADDTVLSRECAEMMGLLKDTTGNGPDQATGQRSANKGSQNYWCFENIAVAAISSANQNCVATLPMIYVSKADDNAGKISKLGSDWQDLVDARYRAKDKSTSWVSPPPEIPAPKKEVVPENDSKSGELKGVLPGMSFSNGPNAALVDMVYFAGADYSIIPRSTADRLNATRLGAIDLAVVDPTFLTQLEMASMNVTLQSVFDVVQVSAYDLGLGIEGGTATLLVSADANSDFGVLGDDLLANGDYLYYQSTRSSFLTLNAVPEPSTIVSAATAALPAVLFARRSRRGA